MIDAVLNSVTGPALVHDEADLEGAVALLVDAGGRCAVLRADGSMRTMARGLDVDLHPHFRRADTCPLIRMDGRRVASNRSIAVRA